MLNFTYKDNQWVIVGVGSPIFIYRRISPDSTDKRPIVALHQKEIGEKYKSGSGFWLERDIHPLIDNYLEENKK